jgi:hypothetical protein
MLDFKQAKFYKNGKTQVKKFSGKKGHSEEVLNFLNVIQGKEEIKLFYDEIYQTTALTIAIEKS